MYFQQCVGYVDIIGTFQRLFLRRCPPKPLYHPAELLDYIEAGVDALSSEFPKAGDFNTLDDSEIVVRSAMNSTVNRPTSGVNIPVLNRIYTNDHCYETVKVVTSTVKSDHKAVIAYTGQQRHQLKVHTATCILAAFTGAACQVLGTCFQPQHSA